MRAKGIDREVFLSDGLEVAPLLLNLLLVAEGVAGRIIEVEAYLGQADAASHAYRGPTARNATMFGPPGHLYVYLSYGVHHCANVVCAPGGVASAVLLRALWPVDGLEAMRARRPGTRRDAELCAGPGRLCAALGIDRRLDGADLVSGSGGVQLLSDGVPPPEKPLTGPRVGISARGGEAASWPWRFAVPGAAGLSRPI